MDLRRHGRAGGATDPSSRTCTAWLRGARRGRHPLWPPCTPAWAGTSCRCHEHAEQVGAGSPVSLEASGRAGRCAMGEERVRRRGLTTRARNGLMDPGDGAQAAARASSPAPHPAPVATAAPALAARAVVARSAWGARSGRQMLSLPWRGAIGQQTHSHLRAAKTSTADGSASAAAAESTHALAAGAAPPRHPTLPSPAPFAHGRLDRRRRHRRAPARSLATPPSPVSAAWLMHPGRGCTAATVRVFSQCGTSRVLLCFTEGVSPAMPQSRSLARCPPETWTSSATQ